MAVVSYFNEAARPQTTLPVWPPCYFGDVGQTSLLFSPVCLC